MIEFQLLGDLSRRKKSLIERKRHHGLEGLSDKKKPKNVPLRVKDKNGWRPEEKQAPMKSNIELEWHSITHSGTHWTKKQGK